MASKGVRSSQAISMIRSRCSLGSVDNNPLSRMMNVNDASAHAEVPEGSESRLQLRPVETARITPFSAQIHMAMGGDRRRRQVEGAYPTRQDQGQRIVLLRGVARMGAIGIRPRGRSFQAQVQGEVVDGALKFLVGDRPLPQKG